MKKNYFITLILALITVFTFGIGMCMCLLPEWKLFDQGLFVGCIGLVLLIITVIVYRKLEHIKPLNISLKSIFITFFGIFAVLCFGVGMSLTMVYNYIPIGIGIGLIGIILMVCLIPMVKGFK